tara:strand:+ start:1382 stop:2026 length:645 start_codon:yes stop_codon:yes gene_type:complete
MDFIEGRFQRYERLVQRLADLGGITLGPHTLFSAYGASDSLSVMLEFAMDIQQQRRWSDAFLLTDVVPREALTDILKESLELPHDFYPRNGMVIPADQDARVYETYPLSPGEYQPAFYYEVTKDVEFAERDRNPTRWSEEVFSSASYIGVVRADFEVDGHPYTRFSESVRLRVPKYAVEVWGSEFQLMDNAPEVLLNLDRRIHHLIHASHSQQD